MVQRDLIHCNYGTERLCKVGLGFGQFGSSLGWEMLRLVLRLIGQVGFEQFESSSVWERFRLLLRLIGQVLGGIFK